MLKRDMEILSLQDYKESTISEVLFTTFKSLIMRLALMRVMQSSHLNEKYSVERMLLELEKLHMIEDQNSIMKELERTRKQKDILDKVSWW